MSQEVALLATIQAAPGKAERLKELTIEAIEYIKANEPESLEFSLYQQGSGDNVTFLMHERYVNQAALDKHASSDNYKKLFETISNERLVKGDPVISQGSYIYALRR